MTRSISKDEGENEDVEEEEGEEEVVVEVVEEVVEEEVVVELVERKDSLFVRAQHIPRVSIAVAVLEMDSTSTHLFQGSSQRSEAVQRGGVGIVGIAIVVLIPLLSEFSSFSLSFSFPFLFLSVVSAAAALLPLSGGFQTRRRG